MRPVAWRGVRGGVSAAVWLTFLSIFLAMPALAEGGNGGGFDAGNGIGGADSTIDPGTAGTDGAVGLGGGGGGGAGLSGGGGGTGNGFFGAGGAGGTAGGGDGENGEDGAFLVGGGGGGGGGGGHGSVATGLSVGTGSTLQGGKGGDGGVGYVGGAGGGGGAGGYGAVVTGSDESINAGTLAGGMGGRGGDSGSNHAGTGGTGGIGVVFTTSGASFTNSGTTTGGQGGSGGGGSSFSNSEAGKGGVGVVGTGALTIDNSGTISGGRGNTGGLGLSFEGDPSDGGWGITGDTLTITNHGDGRISGGSGSDALGVRAGDGNTGISAATITVHNSDNGTIVGGNGGSVIGSSGYGGDGGWGINGLTLTITNSGGVIAGGDGGNGRGAGGGGHGNHAIYGFGNTVINSDGARISGGDGGSGEGGGGHGGAAIRGVNRLITNGGGSIIEGGDGGDSTGTGTGGAGGEGIDGGVAEITNAGTIRGGAGGSSGPADSAILSPGAVGGAGGVGITAGSVTITNTGAILGGAGGAGGNGNNDCGGCGGGRGDGGAGGAGGTGITGSDLTIINSGAISAGSGGSGGIGDLPGQSGTDGNAIAFTGGSNSLQLNTGGTITGNVVVIRGTATLTLGGEGTATFDVSQIGGRGQYQGFSNAFTKTGTGVWTFTNTTAQATAWTVTGGLINFASGDAFGTGPVTLNGGGLQWADGTSTDISGRLAPIGSNGATFDTRANTVTFGSALTGVAGDGGITKTGSGTLTLAGANAYTGTTTVDAGTLALTGSGSIATSSGVNLAAAGARFDIAGIDSDATIQDLTGVAGTTVNLGARVLTLGTSNSTVFAGTITGTARFIKQGSGTLTLTGDSTIGGIALVGGQLTVMGSVTGGVVAMGGTTLAGSGTITGGVVTLGNIQPTFGTMHIDRGYVQTGGTYTVGVTAAGTSDLISITGAAVIANSTVVVLAAPGTYQRQTRYTILTATGGINGHYDGVTSNLAFLTPSLSSDGSSVFLTLLQTANAFETGGQTPNQKAVGRALDTANSSATGDFASVLNALYGLDTMQGAKALDALSGQNYAGFSSLLVQTMQLFMKSFQFHAGFDGSGGGAGLPGSSYQALRTGGGGACEQACDVEPLWGAWGGGTGAFGTIAGTPNANGFTYSLGGFIAGLDRRFAPNFRAGVAAGFNAASLYPQGSPGNGTSNTLQIALYGAFNEGPLYLDALAGYGHSDNRMSRPITIPGLNQRIAQGHTTANTFFGQLETGYKMTVAPRFGGSITPFARLQASTSTQAGFTETGADSLNLIIAQQTTNSLRMVLGAQLGAEIDTPWDDDLDLAFSLGWSHEYADLSRPVTAAFAGAPVVGFTTFGAEAPRDGVVLGLGADTEIAEQTTVYLRYDGDLAGASTNHVLNAGVRMTW
jgi:uncharacterized protein with beta-barrel porin domain